ncbi:MAG: DNA adenine methylase [Lachnospiraceae bacterium]
MPTIGPFVRWAGGKTWLIPHIPTIMGNLHIKHYHEPFLGGGAIYFSMEHTKRSYLSDTNSQLINTYIQVRDNPEELIEFLRQFPNTEDDYYKIRAEITDENTIENAARFLYLNQTSYNGLYRVNQDGRYNVPYGFRANWVYDPERIRAASLRLQNTRISTGDFEVNKYRIKENDLVFLDPPYTVSHNNNGFIAYNQKLFSLEDQQRLKRFIEYIKAKGAFYILTNAAHETIREIFLTQGDKIVELQRNSLIGGRNATRAAISEYIFTNIPEVNHE